MLIKFTDDTKWGGVANIGWPDFLSENLDHLSWQAERKVFSRDEGGGVHRRT